MNPEYNVKTLALFAKSHGASPAFVRVITTESDGRHLARSKMVQSLRDGRAPSGELYGHFLSALWEGDVEKAYTRADATNTKILERAGVLE